MTMAQAIFSLVVLLLTSFNFGFYIGRHSK